MKEGYSRVYYGILTDPKFDGVVDDPKLLGAWLILLLTADMVWPSPVFVPAGVPQACVRALSERGLIDLLPGRMYRVHGLDAERERRSEPRRRAANARWS